MRQKRHIDFTILVAGALILAVLFATSCTPVKSFKGQNCSGNKAMNYHQGYTRKAFKF